MRVDVIARGVLFGLAMLLGGCRASSAASTDASAMDARARDAGADVEAGTVTTTGATADAALAEELALPAATSDELTNRARHLFEAIAQDNPELGVDMLFPRDAWIAARDASDPAKQWDVKTAAQFRRAVHALHKRTKGIERAQFASFEIGRTVTQASPRHKEWKVPLWETHRGHIAFTLDGREMRFEVSELAAWRGAWYVTKLR